MEERTLGYNLHHKKTSKIGKHEINYKADIYNLERVFVGQKIGWRMADNFGAAFRKIAPMLEVDQIKRIVFVYQTDARFHSAMEKLGDVAIRGKNGGSMWIYGGEMVSGSDGTPRLWNIHQENLNTRAMGFLRSGGFGELMGTAMDSVVPEETMEWMKGVAEQIGEYVRDIPENLSESAPMEALADWAGDHLGLEPDILLSVIEGIMHYEVHQSTNFEVEDFVPFADQSATQANQRARQKAWELFYRTLGDRVLTPVEKEFLKIEIQGAKQRAQARLQQLPQHHLVGRHMIGGRIPGGASDIDPGGVVKKEIAMALKNFLIRLSEERTQSHLGKTWKYILFSGRDLGVTGFRSLYAQKTRKTQWKMFHNQTISKIGQRSMPTTLRKIFLESSICDSVSDWFSKMV